MLQQDPSATADYKTLKSNTQHFRMMQNRSSGLQSSISMQRLDRELSPDRTRGGSLAKFDEEGNLIENKSPPKDPQKTTEQLIHELTLDVDDEQDRMDTLKNEALPGSCKSQYALKFRFQTEQDNADFMQRKDQQRDKTLTKGRFPIQYQTNAGVWVKDREWKRTANPNSWKNDERREAVDNAMLEKRKKQKLLQNTALEAQYKI